MDTTLRVGMRYAHRSVLGGWLGDWAARRAPKWGRIAVAQCSVGIGVPLTVVALKLLPKTGGGWSAGAYASLMGVMGLTMTWCAHHGGAACIDSHPQVRACVQQSNLQRGGP